MPEAARANPWLDAVGAAAGSAYRDLPFGRITVPPPRRWAGNTTDGLGVQIGVDRKGEPQHFVMGVRGVHHGLVGDFVFAEHAPRSAHQCFEQRKFARG